MAALESNWKDVRAAVAAAASRSGRDAADVQLLAITKSATAERAAELFRLGQTDLGESRADELERKVTAFAELGLEARWHFVGHLQRNKARRVVCIAAAIHSIDTLELLDAVARAARDEGRCPQIYLQVKVWPEEAKSGFAPEEVRAAALRAGTLREVTLVGLMAMAPLLAQDQREAAARETFRSLASLARELAADPEARAAFRDGQVKTSMGMSDDFEIAVEEGSDLVRVGSALFAGLEPARATGAPRGRR